MKKFLALSLALMLLVAPVHASVSNQTNKVFGSGNGITHGPFSFPFKIFAAAELAVYEIDSLGVVTGPMTLTTDYTVHVNTTSEGGYVTFVTAPAAGTQTLIERVEPYTQSLVLASEGPLPAKQIENQLDLQTMDILQLKDAVDRALIQDVTSLLGTLTLPAPKAGFALGWDPTGTSIINISATGPAGPPGPAGPGNGDVLGPATNTNLYIPQWAGANTKTLANGVMLDTDGALTANSDARIPTQQAVKSYAAKKGVNSNITSLTGLTTPLPTSEGGTGSTAAANGALGVVVLDAGGLLPAVDGSQLTNLPNSGIAVTTFTSSGTWTRPAGANMVKVVCVGGGGGGGQGDAQYLASACSGGSGGGGGARVERTFRAADLGATETVTIGDGGTTNNPGGTTSFGTKLYAYGGGAGTATNIGTSAHATGGGGGGIGGVGGAGGNSASIGGVSAITEGVSGIGGQGAGCPASAADGLSAEWGGACGGYARAAVGAGQHAWKGGSSLYGGGGGGAGGDGYQVTAGADGGSSGTFTAGGGGVATAANTGIGGAGADGNGSTCGSGGGGAGGVNSGDGYRGGNGGAWGGGGGGGGACQYPSTGGLGGSGGKGGCIVYSW